MAAAAARRLTNSSGLTALSHRLTTQLTAAGSEGRSRNLIFSPLSIYSALSLVAGGGQGRTLREMLDLLGARSREELAGNVRGMVERAFPETQQPGGPPVVFASGLWHDVTQIFKPAYRDAAATSCKAAVRAVDFVKKPDKAVKLINSWVAEVTRNLIDSIVDKNTVCEATAVVITNAIYFKGLWTTPFEKKRTKEDKFYRLDGSTVSAKFMRSYQKQFIAVHDGFKVLEMPYKAPDPSHGTPTLQYSMFFVLPDARDGLWSLLEKIGASPDFLHDHRPTKPVTVGRFLLPKFKLSFFKSIKKDLEDLGIKAVFSVGAELPDMLEDRSGWPLYVGDVLHKAVIEVNEEGTEAAAATAITLMFGGAAPKYRPVPVDFVADHPFAFFVVEEESGAILFAGHVLDPVQFES